MTTPMETEIKLAVRSAAWARRLVSAAGFRLAKKRAFESNLVFDTPSLRLRKAASLLRVREMGKDAKLTYKGPPQPSKHKNREELELEASDARALQAILERLGFRLVFRYEKYRSEYQRDRRGVITLDETPIGVYLELEGPPQWIDRTARGLGFAETEYITESYGELYREWCRRHRVKPGNMVFRKSPA